MGTDPVRSVCRVVAWALVLQVLPASLPAADNPCTPPPTVGAWQGPSDELGDARRESEITVSPAEGETPLISFIDSPSATCYQPNANQNVCYISWYYLSVGASPNYMICMYAALNDRGIVSYTGGFFQTSMYIPYNMLGQGVRVPCGSLGQGGFDDLGAAYAYTIRAKDSAGLRSANYGTVYCPAYVP